MYHPYVSFSDEAVAIAEPVRVGACLVPGCPCKDARIVSRRLAAFFKAIARRNGETADRTIAPDPSWRLPSRVADALDPIA